MMGVSPEDAAKLIVEKGADIIGTNCGTGIDIRKAAPDCKGVYADACDLPIMAQPNAGQPEIENGKNYLQGNTCPRWRKGLICWLPRALP